MRRRQLCVRGVSEKAHDIWRAVSVLEGLSMGEVVDIAMLTLYRELTDSDKNVSTRVLQKDFNKLEVNIGIGR